MVQLAELIKYTNNLLDIESFKDYCPNGLQVEGCPEIFNLVSGVTASLDLIDAAIDQNADALLVHHGYMWKGEDNRIVGIKRNRIKKLLENNINLIAYHLPLDAHPIYGNNVQLAQILSLSSKGSFGVGPGPDIALHGELTAPMTSIEFSGLITAQLGHAPIHIGGSGKKLIRSIGWCTGSAQSYIEKAVSLGLDAYLTGEISEQTVHIARETGIHFFAAGHHATERYGVKALGNHLSDKFDLKHEFIDIDNPV